ncbi:MAG TPA: SDR family oxidoreductase [Longimicrobiales bacterium]|nr:SDR family oxidoreductase [Longimicrobiales bacterium]
MTSSLQGRTVIVTGGSMGIGYACAAAAHEAGANVVMAARGEAELINAADRLGPARVLAHTCDVSDESQVADLFAAAASRFGALDGVVHAAAIVGPIGEITGVAAEEWLGAVRVDLFGAFLVARAAARALQPQRRGKIVLLSGGGATAPFPRYSAYACSKVGVVRLAETLAVELAPYRIDVNALAPGFVATRIHQATLSAGPRAGADYLEQTRAQLEAGGSPASLAADAAVFLLSSASDGITGRLLAAAWDDWRAWPSRAEVIRGSDLFTLRRIVPRDRGMPWQ